MVVASHAIPLGAFGTDAIHNRTTLGTIGVSGFFAISGYLVAQSADRNNVGRYLWRRFLRIFPGFWVCLVVTAALFGTIGWLQAHHTGCGASCYLGNEGSHYVVDNFWLDMTRPYIFGTKIYAGVPLINSPLWTLFYEFLCYLILAALSVTRLLCRPAAVLALTAALWGVEGYVVLAQRQWSLPFGVDAMLTLAPLFLTGTLVYLYRESLPDSGWLALGLAAVFLVSPWLPIGRTQFGPLTNFVTAGSSVDWLAPAMVYPVLWLGSHLPFQRVGAKNDYSYGFYVYAYPVQRLLAVWGVWRAGYVVYLLACVAATTPFAVASWWLIEKRALRLKDLDPKTVVARLRRAIEPPDAAPADGPTRPDLPRRGRRG
jgi:peptidoglycan/LPS O-acetylase OafA/YrhL